jgi:hypothetical protein
MPEDVTPELRQQRMKEFLQLLPLTLELAGLPKADPLRLYNSDQLEARASNIRSAYKQARSLLRDIGDHGV